MKSRILQILILFGVIAFPCVAWADVGTPLIWAGMIHLIIGNAVIGLGEGLLLAWLFSVPKFKSVLIMVPANYFSAWMGAMLISGSMVNAISADLNNGWRWFWVMVLLTYIMTLVLEWPFVAWCLRNKKDWLRKSVAASLVVQSTSYILLFGWYWIASDASLYTQMKIVSPADLALPESVMVYYISLTDGNVYKRQSSDKTAEKIYTLHSADKNDRLFVRPSSSNTNHWDLMARLESRDRHSPIIVNVLTNLPIEATAERTNSPIEGLRYVGTWFNFGPVPSLGIATNSSWKFRAGFWPVEGLQAENEKTKQVVRFSYETPFGSWTVRNAIHLPQNKVLFQLGDNQICLFSPLNREVTLLCHGKGPVAIIEPR